MNKSSEPLDAAVDKNDCVIISALQVSLCDGINMALHNMGLCILKTMPRSLTSFVVFCCQLVFVHVTHTHKDFIVEVYWF